ncbi:MAG: hypothetical protein ACRDPE_07515 [Solirubrobacterales bacterium]
MRIGYLIDTSKGGYDQPLPPQDAQDSIEAGLHLIMGSPGTCIEQLERHHEELGVRPIDESYPAPDYPVLAEACRW